MFFLRVLPVISFLMLAVAVKGQNLEEAECPHNKPHKCPYRGMCYDLFQYCGPEGPEDCVNTHDTYELCLEVARGKNMSDQIRHESCNLPAACVSKPGFKLSHEREQDESSLITVVIILSIFLVISVILLISAVFYNIRLRRLMKSSIASPGENGLQDCVAPSPPLPKEYFIGIREERELAQDLPPEANSSDEEQQHLLGEERDIGSANPTTSPDSEAPLCTSIRNDATDRQSAQPVQNAHGWKLPGTTSSCSSSDTPIHPAEEESKILRSMHIPATPSESNEKHMMATSLSQHVSNADAPK